MITALALRARPGITLSAAALAAFGALIASAILGALLPLALGASHTEPHDAIDDSPAAAAILFAHNLPAAGVPLAIGALGWDRIPSVDRLGDLVVGTLLIVNGAIVGYAFARTGPELAAYLPHLPFEWGAFAITGGAWICLSLGPPQDRRGLLVRALWLAAIALLIAAVLEVYAAPLG